MTCRAILWDMDGTLLDSEPAHAAAFYDALDELGLTVPPGFHESLLGASDDRVHAALSAATGLALTLLEWRAVKWQHYRRHANCIPLRQEVAALARDLAGQGVPMAVVSNSTADEVVLCLGASGLASLFSTTVSRADVTRGKPDPEGYLLAAARLGIPPNECLVVEDSPVGARAGVAAGMLVAYYPQHSVPLTSVPEGAHYISTVGQLAPILRTVLGRGEVA